MLPELNATLASPAELAEQIDQFIRIRTGGTIYGLRVDVHDDRVILSGRTTTYYNKQLATHAALSAEANRDLSNEIEVC